MLLIASIIGQLIATGAELLAKQLARLVTRRRHSLPEVDVPVSEPPQPLTYKDVEHIRRQEAESIAASKRAAAAQPPVDRNAITVGAPKAGKLPKN